MFLFTLCVQRYNVYWRLRSRVWVTKQTLLVHSVGFQCAKHSGLRRTSKLHHWEENQLREDQQQVNTKNANRISSHASRTTPCWCSLVAIYTTTRHVNCRPTDSKRTMLLLRHTKTEADWKEKICRAHAWTWIFQCKPPNMLCVNMWTFSMSDDGYSTPT